MARPSRIRPALDALMVTGDPHAWTLEELQEELERRGRPASFSSVFRAAHQAVLLGHWRKVALDDGKTRFEPATRHHDHLLCERCGSLRSVPCSFPSGLRLRMERATGYCIRDHALLWQGLCPACRPGTARKPAPGSRANMRRPEGHKGAKRPC